MESSPSKLIDVYVRTHFYQEYLSALKETVRIPSLSPSYDPEWQVNQNLYRQCDHMAEFCKGQQLANCQIHTLKDEGKSPFLIIDIGEFHS